MWKCSKCETLNDSEYCAICGAKKSDAAVITKGAAIPEPSPIYSASSKSVTTLGKTGIENILRIVSIFGLAIHFLFFILPTISVAADAIIISSSKSHSIADYLFTDSFVPLSIFMVISLLFVGVCICFLLMKTKLTKIKTLLAIAANILAFLGLPLFLSGLSGDNTGLFSGMVTISMNIFGWLYLILTLCETAILVMLYMEKAKSKSIDNPASFSKPIISSPFTVSCPNCGSALDADAGFCANCGKSILPKTAPVSTDMFTKPTSSTWATTPATATTPSTVVTPTMATAPPVAVSPVPSSGVIKSTFKPKESSAEDEIYSDDAAPMKNTFKKSDDLD